MSKQLFADIRDRAEQNITLPEPPWYSYDLTKLLEAIDVMHEALKEHHIIWTRYHADENCLAECSLLCKALARVASLEEK